MDHAQHRNETEEEGGAYVMTVVFAVVGVLGFISNVLVLLTLVFTQFRGSHSSQLFASLAFSDVILSALLLYPVSSGLGYVNESTCYIWQNVALIFSSVSIYTVMVISLDRYMGVIYPLHRSRIVKSYGSYKLIMCVWALSLVVTLPVWAGLLDVEGDLDIGLMQCHINQPMWYLISADVIIFLLPMCVMCEAYRRVNSHIRIRSKMMALSAGSKTRTANPDCFPLRVHHGMRRSSNVTKSTGHDEPDTRSLKSHQERAVDQHLLGFLAPTDCVSAVQNRPIGAAMKSRSKFAPFVPDNDCTTSSFNTHRRDSAPELASLTPMARTPLCQKLPVVDLSLSNERPPLPASSKGDKPISLRCSHMHLPRSSLPHYNSCSRDILCLEPPRSLSIMAALNPSILDTVSWLGVSKRRSICSVTGRKKTWIDASSQHQSSKKLGWWSWGGTRYKTTVTLLVILCSFTIFWLPFFLLLPICHLKSRGILRMHHGWCTGSLGWAMSYSLVNPFLYTWPKADYRRAFWRLLRCKQNRRTILPSALLNRNALGADDFTMTH